MRASLMGPHSVTGAFHDALFCAQSLHFMPTDALLGARRISAVISAGDSSPRRSGEMSLVGDMSVL